MVIGDSHETVGSLPEIVGGQKETVGRLLATCGRSLCVIYSENPAPLAALAARPNLIETGKQGPPSHS